MSNENAVPVFITFFFEGKESLGMLAKVLSCSLMRCLFCGSQTVLKTSDMPLFRIERRQVDEVRVTLAVLDYTEKAMREASQGILFSLSQYVRPAARQWVIVGNAASLALRNIDHLIPMDLSGPHDPQEIDVYWTKVQTQNGERGEFSASPGLWAVRGEYLPMVLEKWKIARSEVREGAKLDEAAVWSEVLRDLPLRKKPFEKGEVYAPTIDSVDWEAVSHAAFVTVPNWPVTEQRKFLQALYFGTYFGDETGFMLNILDP